MCVVRFVEAVLTSSSMVQKSIPMFTPEQASAKSCFAISEEKAEAKERMEEEAKEGENRRSVLCTGGSI